MSNDITPSQFGDRQIRLDAPDKTVDFYVETHHRPAPYEKLTTLTIESVDTETAQRQTLRISVEGRLDHIKLIKALDIVKSEVQSAAEKYFHYKHGN